MSDTMPGRPPCGPAFLYSLLRSNRHSPPVQCNVLLFKFKIKVRVKVAGFRPGWQHLATGRSKRCKNRLNFSWTWPHRHWVCFRFALQIRLASL